MTAGTAASTLAGVRIPAVSPEPRRFRVLVVEDDDTIGRHLETGLRANDYAPTWSRTGSGALAEAERAPYDALLLDLELPDLDGLDVARRMRDRFPHLLIVVLTARTDDIGVITGLEAGADDHLAKPFTLSVLLDRLRAHLRPRYVAAPLDEPVRLGDLVLDVPARNCTLDDAEVPLRPEEFDLLALLARYSDTAVSRKTLMARVWDENRSGSTKTLDATVASLRRRLTDAAESVPRTVRLPRITALRGHGYRLETDPA
ncbi:response regulator transcription factor [Streptomyces sp. NPDC006012]|uniref:response regulator transcription factor n=1 Tax=Streptomyces sp. NPDC006012 TaxID=3364739 RepID=UPI0036CB8D10